MLSYEEDENKYHEEMLNTAKETIDEFQKIKISILNSGRPVPKFINYVISYLNSRFIQNVSNPLNLRQ